MGLGALMLRLCGPRLEEESGEVEGLRFQFEQRSGLIRGDESNCCWD